MVDYLKQAKQLAKGCKSGTRFKVRDLFPKQTWENIPINTRIQLGKDFYQDVKDGKVADVIHVPDLKTGERTDAQNHNWYKKI